jgi:hypothetical protein
VGTGEEREQELNALLAHSRQEYRRLLVLVGDPTSVDPASLAEHQKRELSSTLGTLLWNIDRVESLLGDASLEGSLNPSHRRRSSSIASRCARRARTSSRSTKASISLQAYLRSLTRPE